MMWPVPVGGEPVTGREAPLRPASCHAPTGLGSSLWLIAAWSEQPDPTRPTWVLDRVKQSCYNIEYRISNIEKIAK